MSKDSAGYKHVSFSKEKHVRKFKVKHNSRNEETTIIDEEVQNSQTIASQDEKIAALERDRIDSNNIYRTTGVSPRNLTEEHLAIVQQVYTKKIRRKQEVAEERRLLNPALAACKKSAVEYYNIINQLLNTDQSTAGSEIDTRLHAEDSRDIETRRNDITEIKAPDTRRWRARVQDANPEKVDETSENRHSTVSSFTTHVTSSSPLLTKRRRDRKADDDDSTADKYKINNKKSRVEIPQSSITHSSKELTKRNNESSMSK